MIFVDTNVLLDVIEAHETLEASWSRSTFARLAGEAPLVSNLIVAAELAGQSMTTELLGETLSAIEVDLVDLDLSVAVRAGQAFRDYRRRGGERSTILPDFLIAAHAAMLGAMLLTRDRGMTSYFPELTLSTPETHPHG